MSLLIYIFVFVFGLIIGSFLNAVIYRIKVKKSILFGRSICPKCKKTLKWYDLVPVLSYLAYRGKCRYCKKPISLQYPLVEFLTGILFVLFTFYFFPINQLFNLSTPELINSSILLLYNFIIVSFLIVIFVYDLKWMIVPDKVIIPAIVFVICYLLVLRSLGEEGLSYLGFYQFGNLPIHLNISLGVLLGGGLFYLLNIISKGRWIGGGDVKLGIFMGLVLGFPLILVALFLAVNVGALVGVFLIYSNKRTIKSEIPFGPFLVGATIITMLWGNLILGWYFSLMGI